MNLTQQPDNSSEVDPTEAPVIPPRPEPSDE